MINRALTTNDDLPLLKKHQNAVSGSTALSGDITTMNLPANFYAAGGGVTGFPYGSAWNVLVTHYEDGNGGNGFWSIEATDAFTGAKYIGIKRGDAAGWQGWAQVLTDKVLSSGNATRSGDGITTEFSIPHGLATTPSYVHAMARSDDADNTAIRKVTASATHVLISYKVAPPAGDGNLTWNWMARV